MSGRRREPAEGEGCPGGVRGGGSCYWDRFLSPHAQAGPSAALPCSGLCRLPVAPPRRSPSPPSSPEREPLLAPIGSEKASTAAPPAISRPSALAGAKLPALTANREASGSPALLRASHSVPHTSWNLRGSQRGSELSHLLASSGAARRQLLLSCGLHWCSEVTPGTAAR